MAGLQRVHGRNMGDGLRLSPLPFGRKRRLHGNMGWTLVSVRSLGRLKEPYDDVRLQVIPSGLRSAVVCDRKS